MRTPDLGRLPGCVVLLIAACTMLSCDGDSANPGAVTTPEPLVFTRSSLTLVGLGERFEAPAAVGVKPSPATMSSDDPTIVQVTHDGGLRAIGTGETLVRGRGGSILAVSVLDASLLRIEPASLELAPGESARLTLVDGTGKAISHEEITWGTSEPAVGFVSRGVVKGREPGRARIVARIGAASAEVALTVESAGSLRVVASAARVPLGGVVLLSVSGVARPTWSVTPRGALAAIGEGLFEAKRAGRARVCAEAGVETGCTFVEVDR